MSELTRRDMLKLSAAGAAGLLLPKGFAQPSVIEGASPLMVGSNLLSETLSVTDIVDLCSASSVPVTTGVLDKVSRDALVFAELRLPFDKGCVKEIKVNGEDDVTYVLGLGEYLNELSVRPLPPDGFEVTAAQGSLTNRITLLGDGSRYLDGRQYGLQASAALAGGLQPGQSRSVTYWQTYPLVGVQGDYIYYGGPNSNSNVGWTNAIGAITLTAMLSILFLALGVPSSFSPAKTFATAYYGFCQSNYPWSTAGSYKGPYYYKSSGGPYIPSVNGACIQYRFTFYGSSNYNGIYNASPAYWYYWELY